MLSGGGISPEEPSDVHGCGKQKREEVTEGTPRMVLPAGWCLPRSAVVGEQNSVANASDQQPLRNTGRWINTDGDLCACSAVYAEFIWGRCVRSSDTLAVRHSLKRRCLPNAEQASWPPTKEKSLMQWEQTLISEHHIMRFQAAEL